MVLHGHPSFDRPFKLDLMKLVGWDPKTTLPLSHFAGAKAGCGPCWTLLTGVMGV